jgi:GH24 family phage-related lysozyme (muramidase)
MVTCAMVLTTRARGFIGTRPLNPSQKPTEVQADAAADLELDALGLEAAAAQEAPERVAA